MKEAVDAVELCFREIRDQTRENAPRTRTYTPDSSLNVLHSSLPHISRAGVKAYLAGGKKWKGAKFGLFLFDTSTGELLAVMAANALGKFRTGAASAVATKYLTGLKSFKLGLAGSGGQATTQVTALMQVANLERVSIWSPHKEKREALAQKLGREHGLDCVASESLTEAFRGSDVATTITTSKDPFVTKEDAHGLVHINAVGSNRADRSEVSPDAIELFSTICVDDLAQAKVEAGDLINAAKAGKFSWENAVELKDVVQSNKAAGSVASNDGSSRGSGNRTFFKSLGIGAEDVALASVIYENLMRNSDYLKTIANFDFSKVSG